MAKTWTCYIWEEGDRVVRRYSVLEYFPFKPMNNKFNDDTRAALGGDSHVTDTEQNIFSKTTTVLGYLSSKIKNNTIRQNIFSA